MRFTNVEEGSAARGLVKVFELTDRAACLFVRYTADAAMNGLSIDCGLSPDYLTILRKGSSELKPVRTARIRGSKSKTVAAVVEAGDWSGLGESPRRRVRGTGGIEIANDGTEAR